MTSSTGLRAELEDLRHRAGLPSLREIGRQAGCSHTTVSKIFADPTSSTWKAVGHVVSSLGGDTNYFRTLWYQATGGMPRQEDNLPASLATAPAGGPADCLPVENWLLTELESSIGLAADPQAMARLHLADEITLFACRLRLQQDLCRYYGMAAAMPGRRHLRVGNHILRYDVEADPMAGRTMRVTIHDQWTPMAQHHTEELSIGPRIGRFNRLMMTAPGSLIGWLVETCADRLATLITSAYRWVDELITQGASLVSSPFEEEALHVLRKFLPSELLTGPAAQSVFLVLVTQGRVSYAIDETVIRAALAASQANVRDVHVPAIAVSDMFFNSIPFTHSFSRRAVGGDRPVPVDLSRAPYQRIAQDYLLAETAIHHGSSLLAPLARAADVVVLASYPMGISSPLAAVMSRVRAELAPRAAEMGGTMRAPLNRDANRPGPPRFR